MKQKFTFIAGVYGVLSLGWTPLDEKEPPARPPPSCVKVRKEARYIMGYDHLVHLENSCKQTAHCSVSTNVNPKAQKVTLAPGDKETVLTFRGSPARTFEARVECELGS